MLLFVVVTELNVHLNTSKLASCKNTKINVKIRQKQSYLPCCVSFMSSPQNGNLQFSMSCCECTRAYLYLEWLDVCHRGWHHVPARTANSIEPDLANRYSDRKRRTCVATELFLPRRCLVHVMFFQHPPNWLEEGFILNKILSLSFKN